MSFRYTDNVSEIELSAKLLWQKLDVYKVIEDKNKSSFYYLDMFPYPSASGLHIGHPLGYIAGDIYCRYLRMTGKNVLHTIGFDSFGLPAEQFAIETNQHPSITTHNNIENIEKQLKHLSLGYDWSRVIDTSDPKYYKWTQWIFAQMYDSFFDPNDIWQDDFGNEIIGKAKNINILKEKLENNKWSIINNEIRYSPSNIQYSKNEINEIIANFRLAYLKDVEVNWCPKLGTVLSNEEVSKDGKSERGNYPVEKIKLKQWMLRITAYSERLFNGLEKINFPEPTKIMQQNWIGKSQGAIVRFKTFNGDIISTYTTRADTLLGVTYIAVSKNEFLQNKLFNNSDNLQSGDFTGQSCIHPITGDSIPIYIADYVIDEYGTGYVMGVPAHDQRDFEFALQHNIAMKAVIIPPYEWLQNNYKYTDINSDLHHLYQLNPANFNSAFCLKGYNKLCEHTIHSDDLIKQYAELGLITLKNAYKLRDWVFSRQRYWGEPFPIVFDVETGDCYLIDESELPLELPDMHDFKPVIDSDTPTTPLSKCSDWVYVVGEIIGNKVITKNFKNPENTRKFRRETNTMPNWAGSSWYYLRYIDPNNMNAIFDKAKYDYWCKDKYATCDMYLGGSEHAVLHFLYARFYHMFLFDIGVVSNPEPFEKVVHQGLITADAYTNSNGTYIDIRDVKIINNKDGVKEAMQISTKETLNIEPGKMGKRYKNGLPPEEICNEYSIDVFRLHMMYMAPITQTRPWQSESIIGMQRFCTNICVVIEKSLVKNSATKDTKIAINKLIKSVTTEYDNMRFNTAIAFMIKFINNYKDSISIKEALIFLRLLSPLAPHLSEYWYQEIKKLIHSLKASIILEDWPKYNENLLESNKCTIQISVNNKIKYVDNIENDITDDAIHNLLHEKQIIGSKILIFRKNDKIIVNVNI